METIAHPAPSSTTTASPGDAVEEHFLFFFRLLDEIQGLSGQIEASVYAAKSITDRGREFHHVMYALQGQLADMKVKIAGFELAADEYERLGRSDAHRRR
jgi:hypothetical protein